jgi:4-oxalocrotonate tautomerase
MPTITVEGPPIPDLAKKRELVRTMTDAAARVYGLPAQVMVVMIRENPPENVGVGGELLVDRKKK